MESLVKFLFVGMVICSLAWFSLCEPQSKEYLPPKGGKGGKGGDGGGGGGEPANYEFSYEVQESDSNLDFGHMEKRNGDKTSGSYHVLLPDGRTQFVEYTAGADGYNPKVRYEGEANFEEGGGGGKDGYNYNAASNHQPVRKAAPKSIKASTSTPVTKEI